MCVKCIPTKAHLYIEKLGGVGGIPNFLIIDPKHVYCMYCMGKFSSHESFVKKYTWHLLVILTNLEMFTILFNLFDFIFIYTINCW